MSHPALALLADLWPNWRITPALSALWSQALADHEPRQVAAAIVAHARSSTWPPALADILAYLEPAEHTAEDDLAAIDTYRETVSETRGDTSEAGYAARAAALDRISPTGQATAERVWSKRYHSVDTLSQSSRRTFLELWGRTEQSERRAAQLDQALAALPQLWKPREIAE